MPNLVASIICARWDNGRWYNCSYLPRAAGAGSNGTNKGQIRKVPVDEIARFFGAQRECD